MRVQRVIARPAGYLAVLASACVAACTGPQLTIARPDGHGLYLDGRLVSAGTGPADESPLAAASDGSSEEGSANGGAPDVRGDGATDVAATGVPATGDPETGNRRPDGREPEQGAPPAESTDLELPFRYYGKMRWDAIPHIASEHGVPRFDAIPTSREIDVPVPASRWLFPFDFPLELIDRILHGRRDQRVETFVEPPRTARFEQVSPAELLRVRERALGARGSR